MNNDITTKVTANGSRVCVSVTCGSYTKLICHDLSAPAGKTRVRRSAPYVREITAYVARELMESADRCIGRFDKTKLWMREFGSDHAEVDFISRTLHKLANAQ